ncbi:polysaccharide biosynthesis tyrosine autokinase [Akkermansiaceae bacterium]|nr:polysaccharide biosynthesis tyrosine autokinase [Akkermansiaceae bacterium]
MDPDPFDDDDDFESGSESSRERLRLLLYDLLGRWHWIALGLILGVLGSLYYLSKAPKIYAATSTLLVKQGASSVISRDEDEDLDLRQNDAVNTVAERVKRADLLTKVASNPAVDKLEGLVPEKVNWFPKWSSQWLGGGDKDLQEKAPAPPALGQIIGRMTTVNVRRKTRLLDIAVSHPVPEIARVLADTIAQEYIKELGTDRSEGQGDSSEVLQRKSDEAEKVLQTKENAKANYQQILALLQTLEEKEILFSELDRRYLPKHPKLIGAKATLDEYQKRFLSEFDLVRKALADKEYWETNRAEWDQPNLDDKTRFMIARRLLTARATVLESDIESQRGVFDALVTKRLETDVNREAIESEVELSNLSQLPTIPSSPEKAVVLGSGGILGLASGFALAFLLVKLDNKIHTVPQAELLTNLHVLATIHDTQPKVLEKIISEKGTSSELLSPAARKWDPRIVFRPGLTESIYAEMFRILRASVTLLGDEKKRKVTLFSSAVPGEGKTLISCNFAIASAFQGNKTVLVDLDLRKPAVHKAFGLKRKELKPGSTELLAGKLSWQEAVSMETGQENLACIFAGARAPNPGELLNSDAVTDLLEELAKEFDVIVIDSAPLLAVPDTRLIIPTVDNFCLVVRAEQTPKSAVRKVIDLLADDGVEPAGIVINGYEEQRGILGYKYRYGYGGYGQYGGGYGSGSYGSYGSYGSDDEEEE